MDLSYLTRENVTGDRLNYTRRKITAKYSIHLEPEATALIKKHSGSKYLVNLVERYSDYDAVKKEINKKLKKAAEVAKIGKPISTYYARHTCHDSFRIGNPEVNNICRVRS